MSCAVIFGGSGFIGCFFADYVLSKKLFTKVYLYDVDSCEEKSFSFRCQLLEEHGELIEFVRGDVCEAIVWKPVEPVSFIANFAAVHREPGHEDWEYFKTNLLGAENVTAWAEKVECNRIAFTSSISPYGISESVKDEATLPVPVTSYGSSKLVAEKIHESWQARDAEIRTLVIARPGVVFGPGEGGNVTRLVSAVCKGYFFYMANRGTRKAGIYVKELCNAIWWMHKLQMEQGKGVVLFNGSMNPGPSISEYVVAVCKVAKVKRFVPSMPFFLLLAAAYCIDLVARPLGISHPFSPVRIRKLVRSNNILPSVLVNSGYEYLFTLETAMQDWKRDCLEDWN
ncbi:NAD-dependent epimerase/dehydratase family protein [Zhongshania aliphaticivorans]|uniref:NAD-dependent epimerase/dehydratase family protein n=1 Tax=Zhongshania aliphaticivorans TaxID=1470434 RepID=UPI0012E472A7|nr:NAD(P)-dependent oxidoreductase [Zhongshania aliphaticivorans]CAA0118110.1 N-acetyl-alpha-D-glucosaminyl-diphospho-ditrans, octacis-undecaprenol 4-epimerase [Zhongshania aliphaticivorans]